MATSLHPATPVPERPLGALDIADGAFAILRTRPRVVAGIAAAFVLPTQLLAAWLNRALYSELNLDNFDTETGQFNSDADFGALTGFSGGSGIATAMQFAILPFIGVALTHLALGWRIGEDRTVRQCLVFTLKRTHIILIALVLTKMIQGLTLLLLTPMTMLVAPVIAAEGIGPIRAVRRSFVLGRRRYGALFGLLCLIVLINVLLGNALSTVPLIGAFLLGDWGWVAFFALNTVGTTVLNILGAGSAVLAYIDTTNRTEGSDISRRLARAQAVHG